MICPNRGADALSVLLTQDTSPKGRGNLSVTYGDTSLEEGGTPSVSLTADTFPHWGRQCGLPTRPPNE